MQKTNIGWTDYSANPLRYRDESGRVVWACVKTSEGCANCYAETLALRWKRGREFTTQNMRTLTPFLDEAELEEMRKSQKIAGKRVFVGDMTDIFGQWVLDARLSLDSLFDCLESRGDVTWQILTKRSTIMRDYFAWRWRKRLSYPANIHLGVSVENSEKAWRINWLRDTPAVVRWVSFEPLIGPIENVDLSGIHWAVIGGESGTSRRPCEVEWIRSLVDQCDAAGVRVYVKQDSAFSPGKQGRIPLDLWQRKETAR